MAERLNPSEYIFCVAPLEKPFSSLDGDFPGDLFEDGSKWFFVESVSITSGGGSYTDPYKSGVHNYGVGTTIAAVWAKAKTDINESARPFAVGDRCTVRSPLGGNKASEVREVARVYDTSRGQRALLVGDNDQIWASWLDKVTTNG